MAAGDILKGKDFRITFVDGTVYHATEGALSFTRNFDEVATKDTSGNIVTPDTYTWNLNLSALVANKPTSSTQKDTSDIVTQALSGALVDVEFATAENGDIKFEGQAYVESFEITAATEGRATYSASFKGNGNLTQTTVGA